MRLRGFSEQQAAADWEQSASAQERVRQGTAARAVHTAKRAALEHAVLGQLEQGGRTQDELVLRLNTTVGTMRPALAALVAWECVSRRPKDNLPDTYYLTAAGRSRLQFVRTLLATPQGASGDLALVALQQLPPPSPPSSPLHPARPVDKVPLWRQVRSWVRRGQ